MFSTSDTIVAIATAPGRGGIGVVRLSGPASRDIASAILRREEPLVPRMATFGRVVDLDADRQRAIDEVVVTFFPAPHSYTTEDVVEIAGHGSPVLLERMVQLAIARGARLANPGEFTFRAYVNGRIDLVQAEAVADLVDAVTPLQARAAMDQLEGTLTTALTAIDAALFDLAARLEASLDFPDEGFHFVTREDVRADIDQQRQALVRLRQDGRAGRLLREGSLVVISGRPNAGKSSLFNALAGASRAIVTDIPGTTRDVLTERVDLLGIPITLVDTAGLRDATDAIEAEGVARARQAQEIAALTLVVIDQSEPFAGALDLDGPVVVVLSKSDLPCAIPLEVIAAWPARPMAVSTKTGDGLRALRDQIVATLGARDDWRDVPAISNVRHLAQIDQALEAFDRIDAAIQSGASEELVLAEMVEAREALEAITGHKTPDDVLRHIFERFCIGK
ncbi:MAG: tRNA uridine-5-carboxymethylaminomethyl(34) synthesis GTPase MnmE [Acidobacteriota bacterium]